MIAPAIIEVGHVAIRVRDLDAAVDTATRIMGLRESHRDGDTVCLTNGELHHTIVYIAADEDAVDHIGFTARNGEALARVRSRVIASGYEIVSDEPLEAGIERGFAFKGIDGFTFEIYLGMARNEPDYIPTGVRPTRFGHINIYARDVTAAERFFVDLMDFRVSDRVEDAGVFLRCNVDHHGVAVLPGAGVLHHHAWEVQGIEDLARLGDYLDTSGRHLLWGPVRHGIGRNIAAYFQEPAGTVVEFYTDMQRIYDDERFEPRTWTKDNQRWYSFWAPMRNPDFPTLGLSPGGSRTG